MSTTLEVPALTRTKKPVEPGIYPGVSFDEYFAWGAVSASTLKQFRKTPAHAYHWLSRGADDDGTPATKLGVLVHLAALEPDSFASEVVVAPNVPKRKNIDKAVHAQFEAENAGKYIVTPEELTQAKAMAHSLLSHPKAAEFFSGPGQNELCVVWDDKETGVRCKSRDDRVSQLEGWPIVGDVKTTADASPHAWERDVAKYGYHLAASHYLAGLEAHFPIPAGVPFRRFLHFVVESQQPYCAAVYELDDSALQEATVLRRQHLRQWEECTRSGIWPGYPPEIQTATLPRWAFKEWREE
jgi:predicted esterase YcpF (UPF0227 family)